ncbi:Rec8 like protein-domain-containing protein [Dendryphion nanum]|uniref:Rec8 like protein-domain-containing protein n=1 Tax=Dendryphion nanum TaxID=256645 RepID=A0A9P9DI01_9PLEO|nr:Rec8 like protein-domain-containing protein [Dendryphion nanum]
MFFPEHLLSKSGPLARVWLAANLEKKLSKQQILLDKIGDDIEVITRPDVAGGPMALRLSGQLLLGVVRIYSRKARYLMDDCNEALMKIKMAFRPGNIDLPTNQSHIANPGSLTLPDVLTEIDLLAPMPDPLLLSQPFDLGFDLEDTTLPDWDNSQFLSGSIEQPRLDHRILAEEDDFGIDIGEDDDRTLGFDEGTSIEIGREAAPELRISEELASSPQKAFEEDDLGIDIGEDDGNESLMPITIPADDMGIDMGMDDVDMGGLTELEPLAETTLADQPEDETALPPRERDSLSPLSDIDPDIERELEQTYMEQQTAFEPQEEEQDETVHQAQRAKRRKVLEADSETQIPSTQIRDQQNDRSKILKPTSFLPRDPALLALINLQKSGGFVSSILGDGRSRGWAPELRGILSLEVISRPQKRKRDSGIADVDTEDDAAAVAEKTPQLEFEQTEGDIGGESAPFGADTSIGLGQEEEMIQLPSEGAFAPQPEEEQEEEDAFSPAADNFDDTTIPLLHPAESGPVSLGTKHAVHLLRERFGPEAETDESQRQKTSVLFQDMLPEATTSKADATKMFFEVLVLATKDAIKVEQPANELGGPLRIRGKRGLWGAWAETSAGGELASQTAQPTTAAPAVEV